MCANVRTSLGPELDLLEYRPPTSLREAGNLSALRDEDMGVWIEWALEEGPRSSHPDRSAGSRGVPGLWGRLVGRTLPHPPCPEVTGGI
jgi:hypothetical protein